MMLSDNIAIRRCFLDSEGRKYVIEAGDFEWQIVYCGYFSIDHGKTEVESPEENVKLALTYLKGNGFDVHEYGYNEGMTDEK